MMNPNFAPKNNTPENKTVEVVNLTENKELTELFNSLQGGLDAKRMRQITDGMF